MLFTENRRKAECAPAAMLVSVCFPDPALCVPYSTSLKRRVCKQGAGRLAESVRFGNMVNMDAWTDWSGNH